MHKRKIIKVGNSYAVTLPREFIKDGKLKVGDELFLSSDSSVKTIILEKTINKPSKNKANTDITPEFKNWVDGYIKDKKTLLEKLAKS